eukprot:753299-Hanusia_phi.AAC.1
MAFRGGCIIRSNAASQQNEDLSYAACKQQADVSPRKRVHIVSSPMDNAADDDVARAVFSGSLRRSGDRANWQRKNELARQNQIERVDIEIEDTNSDRSSFASSFKGYAERNRCAVGAVCDARSVG